MPSVENTEDFADAFQRTLASRKPALPMVKLDINKVVAFNPRHS